jgi:uncharacterized protein (DUF58 family)
MTDDTLFDAEFLGRLRALFFKLRRRRRFSHKGVQPTPASGFTREFKDHRHYTTGDDFRSIDWRLYARLERMFVRVFEEIQEYHIHILVDRSASMLEPYPTKRVAALRLAVAIAYLGLMNQHRVSVMSIGEGLKRELPPLKGQGNIHAILARLSDLSFEGFTDLERSLFRFRPTKDRRGIVFVISDLLGRDSGAALDALRHVWHWPTETHVIQVLDPRELEPDLEGDFQLVEVETGEVRRIWLTPRDMEAYRREVAAYTDTLDRECVRHQVNYVQWATQKPFEEMFVELLSRGSALAGT